jgi:putative ABC transport system permease protein
MLAKRRGFTAAALATLALGIGINTAMFTIVDTVVFRPMPYRDPSRLVKISSNASGIATDDVALLDFLDIRAQNTVFEGVAADDGTDFTVEYAGVRRTAAAALVTSDWLSTLGVVPALGRGFLQHESEPGGDDVAILTHAYWQRRFGADRTIVGKTVLLDKRPVTIVGVLPPNVLRYGADLLRPLVAAEYPSARTHADLDVIARLRPGVDLARARADVATIGRRLQLEYPSTNKDRGFSVIPLEKYYASIDGKAARGLLLMLGAVMLVLLIACVNVTNLMLARAIARYRECVLRIALGATRGRLVRQLLAENLLLFVAGGALGAFVARWLVDVVVALGVREGYVPERMAIALDARALSLSLLASIAIGVAFGLAVAVRASRVDVSDGLKESSYHAVGGCRRGRLRRTLIVAELALSLVLLIGFSLIARSFVRIQSTAAGIDVENLLETAADGGRQFPAAVTFWKRALDAARSMPGVQLTAVTSRPPVHGGRDQRFEIEGRLASVEAELPRAGDILISADYFRTLGIQVVKGRAFTDTDDHSAPPAVVISQTLANRYFANENPLGRRVAVRDRASMLCCSTSGPVEGVWREIVGVVGDVRQGNLDEEPAATLYRPYTQIVEHDMYLMIRAQAPAAVPGLIADLGSRLQAATGAPWSEVHTMGDVIRASESLRLRRFVLILLGSFAALAVLLAAIGLYGVVAYSVAERRGELAVRMALGATAGAIVAQVLRESLRLALTSLLIGTVAAYSLARLAASLLFGVAAMDALSYVSVSLFLVAMTLLASYLPARRAAQSNPLRALHDS